MIFPSLLLELCCPLPIFYLVCNAIFSICKAVFVLQVTHTVFKLLHALSQIPCIRNYLVLQLLLFCLSPLKKKKMHTFICCDCYRCFLNNTFWYDCLLKKRGKKNPNRSKIQEELLKSVSVGFSKMLHEFKWIVLQAVTLQWSHITNGKASIFKFHDLMVCTCTRIRGNQQQIELNYRTVGVNF